MLKIAIANRTFHVRPVLGDVKTFNFAKRRIRPLNAYEEVSNVNHFGSVSDCLGLLAAASECMTSDKIELFHNISGS